MLFHNRSKQAQDGFTIPELLIVMVVATFVSISMFLFANALISRYFPLEDEGVSFSEMSRSSQRIASVVRGLTDITQATSNGMTIYSYFSPSDTYVSLVSYYINNNKLMADVTPMNANPPTGTPITANKKTYTIVSNLYLPGGLQLFVYLDETGTPLTLPIADLHTVKGIQINLGIPLTTPSRNGSDTISLQVSLRNRKTNL
jgi:prepilin-type N-terminal cleavage/methylation domain-containing protein